ncbi:hypothetical protein GCM10025868_07820 [Angustibacter aerolatus]|uniref:Lipoprotein n=1 Tax=Angustibacter aerolatus TaxID=1162965 RepID=A0ABQ6JF58_9ACTN|nr:hypothetical protein [Angustibacter aerolatus]GMA85532.1 hypothetical protein GCM10025868_07820 [Angustibacter aerolatus]
MPPTRRRTVLGLGASAVAAGALAGCGVRVGQPVTPAQQTASADQQARDRLGALLAALARLDVDGRRERPRERRAVLRRLGAQQSAQARALSAAPATAPRPRRRRARPPPPPPRRPSLRRDVRRARATLLAALPTVSGPVARLLASCAAGLALHDRALGDLGAS